MDPVISGTDMYVTLSYEQYKEFEREAKAFEETVHGEGTEWYHKSMRLHVGHITFEIHGPNVKARQPAEVIPRVEGDGTPERGDDRMPEVPTGNMWGDAGHVRPEPENPYERTVG